MTYHHRKATREEWNRAVTEAASRYLSVSYRLLEKGIQRVS